MRTVLERCLVAIKATDNNLPAREAATHFFSRADRNAVRGSPIGRKKTTRATDCSQALSINSRHLPPIFELADRDRAE